MRSRSRDRIVVRVETPEVDPRGIFVVVVVAPSYDLTGSHRYSVLWTGYSGYISTGVRNGDV